MAFFSIIHDYGFGISSDPNTAIGIVQHRSNIELRSMRDKCGAYRFGAHGYAKRYAARGKNNNVRSVLPPLEAMEHHVLFDEPWMPPYYIRIERCFALLTEQGQTGITSSYEDLLWFLTVPGSEMWVWIKECAGVEAAQTWIYQQILPPVMVASAYRPYVGVIPDPKPGCLIQAVQPGYFSAREMPLASPNLLMASISTAEG